MLIWWNTAAACITTLLIISSSSSFPVKADYPPSVAYPPKSWEIPDFDSPGVWPILITANFVCGFHCQQGHCLFAISIFDVANYVSPKIVWSANLNNPGNFRALQLSENFGLMLQDFDGNIVWSTNKAKNNIFVSRLNLTEQGNLVVYGRNNEMVWQSFDHPTNTLVPGQALVSGRNLTSSDSWEGFYKLALVNGYLIAFLEPDPLERDPLQPDPPQPQVYFEMKTEEHKLEYVNGEFGPFVLPRTSAPQFIQLGRDGHVRAYQWRQSNWKQVSDLLINDQSVFN